MQVMQRCYQEIGEGCQRAETTPTFIEARRWTFFRKYLMALWEEPLEAIWGGLPDHADFYADKPPVRDAATPEELKHEESKATRQRYPLVKLGQWLASLPVRVSTVMKFIVSYVRYKEGKGVRRIGQGVIWVALLAYLVVHLLVQAALQPDFLREARFFRPLFGWFVALLVWLVVALPFILIAGGLHLLPPVIGEGWL